MVLRIADDGDAPAVRADDVALGYGLDCVVRALAVHVRVDGFDQRTDSRLGEHDDEVHTPQGGDQLRSMFSGQNRSTFSLESPHGLIIVDGHHEHVSLLGRCLQVPHVTDVQQVETAVGEGHGAVGVAGVADTGDELLAGHDLTHECAFAFGDQGSGIGDQGSGIGDQGSGIGDQEQLIPDPRSPVPEVWDALVHPGQKLKPGARVEFEREGVRLHGEVLGRHFHGRRTVRLQADEGTTVAAAIDQIGHIPLPPYIHRADEASDRDRYQTVYARDTGSIAAPTAGLHFTPQLIETLTTSGVELTSITLHVGYGTFKPVRVEHVEEHEVDREHYTVSDTAAAALTRALRDGRRIIAVGTTTTRALESLAIEAGTVRSATGNTRLFIHPGHTFRVVQGLVTNFHLPRSSLLMLVAAFAGRERTLAAYREAVERRYRFYSYGDAMLIL